MRLVANSQLTGAYGTVLAGEEFECQDATALELLIAGRAQKAGASAMRYETKVIVPDERPEIVPALGEYSYPPQPTAQPQERRAEEGRRRKSR